jgi:hypothetical protein
LVLALRVIRRKASGCAAGGPAGSLRNGGVNGSGAGCAGWGVFTGLPHVSQTIASLESVDPQ